MANSIVFAHLMDSEEHGNLESRAEFKKADTGLMQIQVDECKIGAIF